MPDWSRLAIDEEELRSRIEELGSLGPHPEGGLYRPVYSESWQRAMELVRGWMEESGLATRFDAAGSLFGRVEGTESARVVMSGSHIDTVRQGGKYDGALGIHAALIAVRELVRAFGPPRKALEVVATCEEEGSRFPCNFWAARAVCGLISPGETERIVDAQGITIGEAMRAQGLDPARLFEAARDDLEAFLELHIEQGRVLEAGGYAVGVVDTITGMRQLRVQVTGRQDHAGTTPMDLRLDAMAAAAEMIVRITGAAAAMGRPAVATTGLLSALPGAVNIVPGVVSFTVDTRHPVPERRRELLEEIDGLLREVAARRGLEVSVHQMMDHDPVPMDRRVRSALETAAGGEGLKTLVMPSGAGHDAEVFAQRFPAGMLFVPSREGRSHSPAEYTPMEQIVPGVRVLARALHQLAY